MKHRAVCPQILPVVLVLLTCLFSSCSREWKKLFHPQQTVTVSPLAKKLGYSKDRPLVMGMNTSYAPLQYVDDHGRPSGYDVEFTQLLMQRMGIPFTFSPNHWDKMSPGISGSIIRLSIVTRTMPRLTFAT